ncbi:MAG: hypothetical protein IKW60_01165 [Clostridia bacterium]|nr:hypothetical protein [Clostridia bacterium]
MKEKIYTIPVNEAFDHPGECGFCVLWRKLEKEILDYVTGPAYMEEDVRGEMDKAGFCPHHYRKMFASGNRLGLALMLQTRLRYLNSNAKEKHTDSCYACNRMNGRMESYISTFCYLWKTEEEFRAKVLSGQGFCQVHFQELMEKGRKYLMKKPYRSMMETLEPFHREHMERVEEDLDWFVRKFDYRFKDEPWKNSKDAVERSIQKVSGVELLEGGN